MGAGKQAWQSQGSRGRETDGAKRDGGEEARRERRPYGARRGLFGGGRGLGGGFGGVELGEVFGRVFLELRHAGLAAELHQAVGFTFLFVGVFDGGAHFVEAFAGDDAGGERISGGGRGGGGRSGRFVFGADGGGGAEDQEREGEEDFVHVRASGDDTDERELSLGYIWMTVRVGVVAAKESSLGSRMIHPGLVSITFRKSSPAEVAALVKKAGLRGIEWGGDVHVPHGDLARAREVRELTLEHGLATAAYGSYYRAGQSESTGLAFERVLETAVELGAPTIRVWPGAVGSDAVDEEGRWKIIHDLRRIAAMAAKAGVSITTEFHGGTLTDTNESAGALLVEVDHANVFTGWQPHNGEATKVCVAGLTELLPRVSTIHVFHWWPTAAERLPLAEGTERWGAFWPLLRQAPGDRYALLEFVQGDAPEAFLRDAATLRGWLE